MKSPVMQRVSDFLKVESGRIESKSSVVLGGFAVSTVLLGVLAGRAEARDCCTMTCDDHQHSLHTDQSHNDYCDPLGSGHTNCWDYTTHDEFHLECF